MCSPNRCALSRNPFYVLTEQIPILQEHFFWLPNKSDFSGALFSYRTDNDFPGSLFEYQRTDRQIPGRYPFRTDISAKGLGGCFR